MAHFHTLKVKDVRRETPDSVSVSFEIPENLKNEFAYKAGQYLTLKVTIDGEEVRRSYSLSSSPDADNEYRIAVKKVANGKMSGFLYNSLQVGTFIDIMAPEGNFVVKDYNTPKHYVGFAAGSGITPVISILKSVLKNNENNKFTLFYGNKSADETIFKKELDALAAANPERLKVVYVYTREQQADSMLNGRITGGKAIELIGAHCNNSLPREYFICGPEELIMQVSETLKGNGVDKESIHFELFTTPVQAMPSNALSTSTFKGTAKVRVILDDEPYEFDLAANGANILDAAIKVGADAPFSCKGAVCCTCKAKVIEGKAIMDMNYALSDAEVEQGFILACQAHPASENLVVDFDVV